MKTSITWPIGCNHHAGHDGRSTGWWRAPGVRSRPGTRLTIQRNRTTITIITIIVMIIIMIMAIHQQFSGQFHCSLFIRLLVRLFHLLAADEWNKARCQAISCPCYNRVAIKARHLVFHQVNQVKQAQIGPNLLPNSCNNQRVKSIHPYGHNTATSCTSLLL